MGLGQRHKVGDGVNDEDATSFGALSRRDYTRYGIVRFMVK